MKKDIKNTKEKKAGVGKYVVVGAGLAAAAAAGYFLFGPNGKNNQKKIKGWTVKMKGEVLEKIEGAREVTEPIYNKIVDNIANKYLSTKNKKEVEEMVGELKKHWKSISQNVHGTTSVKNKTQKSK